KIYLFLFFIFFMNFGINSQEVQINKDILEINKKLLESKIWLSKNEWWELEFKENNFYAKQTFGDGGEYCNGIFNISKNRVQFLPNDCNDRSNNYPIQKMQCTLVDDLLHFKYSQKLFCNNNEIFWNYNSIIPEGSIRSISGNEAYILRDRYFRTTSNLKIRKFPSVNSKSLQCTSDEINGDYLQRNYLNKNTRIVAYARTINTDKINELEEYWYYISTTTGWNSYCEDEYGWVFGGYLKLSEK
ncbi:hypothetical protein NUH30_19690, partial [Leptospira sp. 85282-16]